VTSYFYLQQKPVYTTEQVYELVSENISPTDKILIVDDVVGVLREQMNYQSDVQHLYISRIPHFAVKVSLSSDDPQINREKLSHISRYISTKGNFNPIDEAVNLEHNPSLILFTLAGLLMGISVGVIISLIKLYLKKY
jgi:hypothetical protein